MNQKTHNASFRDPSGFVFHKDGVLYRQVNHSYARNYDILVESGLYGELLVKGLIIPHEEIAGNIPGDAYKIIKPEVVPFISYPYEWSFSQLKDAALLTLRVQKIALKFGMTLKDASAYNIQFREGRPILIDTLSFEKYHEGMPWAAYRQFCSHFLAPLGLMSLKDIRLGQLLRIYIDGIPLDLASGLLPRRSWMNAAMFFHVHMHARSQKRFGDKKVKLESPKLRRSAGMDLVSNLRGAISGLSWQPQGTEWGDYFGNTNYAAPAFDEKAQAVARLATDAKPHAAWDLGANDGYFSRLLSDRGIPTIAFDIDPAAVEKNYLIMKERREPLLLPLLQDLTNPSAGLGWGNKERESLAERGPVDLALALALIHHISITNNVPFAMSADFFASICGSLIIEFVPKGDSQVERLLQNRGDVFDGYTQENFEREYSRHFAIVERYAIPGTKRTLYLMKKS